MIFFAVFCDAHCIPLYLIGSSSQYILVYYVCYKCVKTVFFSVLFICFNMSIQQLVIIPLNKAIDSIIKRLLLSYPGPTTGEKEHF